MKTTRSYSSRRSAATRQAFRSILTAGVSVAGLLSAGSRGQAADDVWVYSGTPGAPLASTATTGGGMANWDDGGAAPSDYWSLGVKPSTGNNAVINNQGTVNITGAETATDILSGTIAGGSGTYNQSAGTITLGVGWFRLGTAANTVLAPQTNYNLSGGNLTFTGGGQQFNVGEAAFTNAQVTLSGTGTVTGAGLTLFQVGAGASSQGILNVNTGSAFNMNSAAAATVNVGNGAGSTGTLNVAGGTFNFADTGIGTFAVGNGAGSTGVVTVSNGGTLSFSATAAGANNGTNTVVGSTGTGTLNLTGGTVNLTPTAGGYPLAIGRASGANGTINVSSGTLNVGTSAVAQEMWVGNSPNATALFSQTGGTTNVSSWLAVGRNTNGGGKGTLNLSGGVINGAINGGNISLAGTTAAAIGVTNVTGGSLNTPNAIYVTEGGTSTLSISGTGVINQYGGTGLRINTTAAATTTAFGTVNLGDGVAAGGLLSVNNVNTVATGAANSIFNFNGGTLQAKYNNGAFFTAGVANVRNLGAIIDSNAVNITIGQALVHSTVAGDNATDGGLTKVGTGALILTNAGNNYTGNTTINAGVVDAQVAGSLPGLNTAGRVTVNSTGILAVGVGYAGTQTIADVDTARASNTFNSGAGIGVDVNTGTTATYATNLVNDGGANGASTGFAKLGGGTLTLTGANTYSGITRFYGGVLGGNIGTGPLVFDGGAWQVLAGNTVDYSARAVTFNGPATIDTNGSNVTLGSPIAGLGGGALTKQGLGTLTLSGGFNFSPTRAYTPVAQTLGNVFVQTGTLTLTGAAEVLNTGGNFVSIGQGPGNRGILNILNGASFSMTSDFNVADVGGGTGTTPVNSVNGGIVNLSGAASVLNEANLYVGKGGNVATNGVLAYGVFNQSGGTHTATGNSQIGAFGLGQYNLSGGTWNRTGGFLSVARQPGGFGVLDVSGTGVFTDNSVGTRSIIGELGTGVLNVRNGGVFNANTSTTNNNGNGLTSGLAALTLGNGNGTTALTAPVAGIANLLPGGTINTQSIGTLTGSAAANVTSLFNFNGGTLQNTVATTTLIQNLTAASVYGGGAIIDTTAGSATIAQPLVAPAGQGVSVITAGGNGFTTTPIVQITGGGGVGATAIATVDANGNLTGVTITNPGINYTSAPTVTITDAFGTVVTGVANIANNVSGGLTKLGVNTLTLTGANTYTGPTLINAGTLAIGAGGSLLTTRISVASGATFDVSAAAFTLGSTQTLNGVGTVNGGASAITLGGIVAPGATAAAGVTGTLSIATTTLSLTATTIYQLDIVNAATKDLITTAGGTTLNINGSTLAVQGTVTPGVTYTLVNGLTTENGNFANVTVNGAATTLVPTYSFTGGNYNVTFAVPEPSTWALGVFGLGMGALWLRRRRAV